MEQVYGPPNMYDMIFSGQHQKSSTALAYDSYGPPYLIWNVGTL